MIMSGFNLSPETLVSSAKGDLVNQLLNKSYDTDFLKSDNVCMLANGATFRKDVRGKIPILIDGMFLERKTTKDKMLSMKKEIEQIKSNGDYNKNQVVIMTIEANRLGNKEQAIKIFLNSGYGAFSNEHFRYFSTDIAEGITLTGQTLIQFVGNNVDKFLTKEFNKDVENQILKYIDTDSCSITTMLKTTIGDISIGELYDLIQNNEIERTTNNFIKECNDIDVLSYNKTNNQLENNKIKKIKKHLVKKEMFKIILFDENANSKEIICTCDHSILVRRNNNIIKVKPKDVLSTDTFLYLQEI